MGKPRRFGILRWEGIEHDKRLKLYTPVSWIGPYKPALGPDVALIKEVKSYETACRLAHKYDQAERS